MVGVTRFSAPGAQALCLFASPAAPTDQLKPYQQMNSSVGLLGVAGLCAAYAGSVCYSAYTRPSIEDRVQGPLRSRSSDKMHISPNNSCNDLSKAA